MTTALTDDADRLRAEITPEGATRRAVLRAWVHGAARFPTSRVRILAARDTFHGRDRLTITKSPGIGTDLATRLNKSGALPQRKTLALNLIALLSDEEPIYKRTAMGGSKDADAEADTIETYGEAVWEEKVTHDAVVGKLTFDGELGVIVMPDNADPFAPRSYLDTLDPEAFTGASDRTGWLAWRGPDGKPERYTRPKRQYWRDARGKPTDDSPKRDTKKTRAAYDAEYEAHWAHRHPTSVRLVSATDCFPLLVRSADRDRWQCRGLVVRQLYDEGELRRTYEWGDRVAEIGLPAADLHPRAFEMGGTQIAAGDPAGRVYLYELFAYVQAEKDDPKAGTKAGDDVPIVAMCVDGKPTVRKRYDDGVRKDEAAFINLKQAWGLDTLEVGYFWGTQSPDDDPDLIGVPFLDPYGPLLVFAEGLLLTYLAHSWKYAFGKYATVPDPNIPAASYIETGADNTTKLKDFRLNDESVDIIALPGPTAPLQPPPVGDGVRYLTQLMLSIVEGQTPSETVYGGAGAASGHDRELTRRFTETSKHAIREGARRVKQFVGEATLRTVCAMQKKLEVRIPATGNEENQELGADGRPRYRMIEIDEAWLQGNYKLDCVYPRVGNVVEVQQEADLKAQGLASFDDVQEKRGKSSPMNERIKIAEDRWWDGQDGQLQLQEYVARRRGERERAEQLRLILEQRWYPAGHPDGTPMAAFDPRALEAAGRAVVARGNGGSPGLAPAQAPGGVATATPDFPQAITNGVIQGGMGTAATMQDARALAAAPNGV